MTSGSSNIANGPAWAAVVAAGVGCAVFGVLVDMAEAFPRVSAAMTFSGPVGDLSGKSTLAVVVWLVTWAVLHFRWKARDISSTRGVMVATVAFVLVGLVAVFPSVIDLFSAKP